MNEQLMQLSNMPPTPPDAVAPPVTPEAVPGNAMEVGGLATQQVAGEARRVTAVLDGADLPTAEALPATVTPVAGRDVRAEQDNTVSPEALASSGAPFQQPALGEERQQSDSFRAPELTGQELEKLTKMSLSGNKSDLLQYSAVIQSLSSDQLEQLARYRKGYLAQHASNLAVPAETTLATQSGYAPSGQLSKPPAPAVPRIPQPRAAPGVPHNNAPPAHPAMPARPATPPWGNAVTPPIESSFTARVRRGLRKLTGR